MVGTVLSIIAIVVSLASIAITTFQNRRIHNENKRLQVFPIVSEELMVWSRIRCKIETRKDVLNELNVLVSPYDKLYNNNDIIISKSDNPLLTLLTNNSGNGIADNVCLKKITLFTESNKKEYELNKTLFSCPSEQKIATKIYAAIREEEIKQVQVDISYSDILGKT